MKKKMIKISAFVLVAIMSLMGCKKDSRNDDGMADVYIKAVLVDGQPVFGLVHYVVGYSEIQSVVVNMPDQTMDQLNAYDEAGTIFYSEPSTMNGSYSPTVPVSGVYSYGVKFTDGVEKVLKDDLSSSYLLPPTITNLTKALDNSKVSLGWDDLPGAEYYQFNIKKAGVTVFSSQIFSISTSQNYVDIPINVIPNYSAGTYTFELNAFKYTSSTSGKLQATSSASADVEL